MIFSTELLELTKKAETALADRFAELDRISFENTNKIMDAFREQVKGCKVFILCNPHNPGGIVWTEEELQQVADICYEEGVLVFSFST